MDFCVAQVLTCMTNNKCCTIVFKKGLASSCAE